MYHLEQNLKLVPIDKNLAEDVLLTYEILQDRYANPVVNIKYKSSCILPTLEQHKQTLSSNKYKHYYKILFYDTPVGILYVDKDDVSGLFFLNKKLKQVLRDQNIKKLPRDYSLGEYVLRMMFKMHPEIKVHYALVNPKNSFSFLGLLRGGYEEIGALLALRTQDGNPVFND